MAKTLYQCSILLTLLAFHSILLTTECRQLRSITNPPPAAILSDHDEGSKEDFRPTAPGVSPGVGHPNLNDSSPSTGANEQSTKSEDAETGTSNAPGESDNSGGKDDFRPTAPGFSPGVGHSVGLQNRGGDEKTGEVIMAAESYNSDDFRPTAPGFSPGVGHAVLTDDSVDAFRPTKPGQSPGVGHASELENRGVKNRGYSVSGETEDFKPTQPGHSPGVGHAAVFTSSKRNGRKREPTQPGHSPGVGHVAAMNDDGESSTTAPPSQKNDFRPTQPGHSPGIGHKN
ncbi:unnamed protein product [Linum trigynum]|uniref:Precursor of CEP9 n=1 Tax=Linum trigynum TaxID=586398 RepID=A0AAV2GDB3_9ROSI